MMGISNLRLSDVMERHVFSVAADHTIATMIERMKQDHVTHVVVLAQGKPVGMFTERDLARLIHQRIDRTQLVSELMSTPVVVVPAALGFRSAYIQLCLSRLRHVVVVDNNSQVVGVAAERDFLGHLSMELYQRVRTLKGKIDAAVPQLPPSCPIVEVIDTMLQERRGCVLVVEDGCLLGIFTEHQIPTILARHLDEAGVTLGEVMRTDIEPVSEESSVADVVAKLVSERIGYVVVIRTSGEISGVIAQSRLLENVRSAIQAEVATRQLVEDQLLQVEAQLEATLERTPNVAVQWYDCDGRIHYWNPASESLYGWTAIEAMGKTLDELALLTREEADSFRASLAEVSNSGRTIGPTEYQVRNRDGAPRWVDATVFAIPGDQDGEKFFVCMDVEITGRKQAEQSLAKSEFMQRFLVDNLPLAVQVLAPDGRTLRVNHAWEALWGAPLEALAGYNIFQDEQLIQLGFIERLQLAFQGSAVEFPIHAYDKAQTASVNIVSTGRKIWLHAFAYPVMADNGEVLEVVVVQENVTARKLAEDALKESNQRLDFALQGANDGLWDWNLENDEVYYSPRWLGMLGYQPGELPPTLETWSTLVHPDERTATLSLVDAYLAGKNPTFEIEFRMRHKAGHWVNILSRAQLARDERGKIHHPRRLVGTHVDITERKQAAQALARRAQKQALLLKIGRELSATLDLDDVLQIVTKRITELTELTTSAIYLQNGTQVRLMASMPAAPPDFPEVLRHADLADHPHIRRTIETGQSVFLADTRNVAFAPAERAAVQARDLRSILYLPLQVGQEVSGALIVATTGEQTILSESDLEVCNNFASMAALAIANAQLYSASRQQAAELAQQSAFTGSVLKNAPMGIHMYRLASDDQLIFNGANLAADRILGVDNSQFIGMKIEEAFPPLTQTEVPTRYRQIARDGSVWTNDQIVYDGGVIKGAFQIKAFQTAPGQMAVFFEDVTRARQQEQALRESDEQFRSMFELSPDPVWIIDNNHFVECNLAAVEILGYSDKAALHNCHPATLSPERQPDGEPSFSKAEHMMQLAQTQGVHRFEWVYTRKDGTVFYAEVTLSAITLRGRKVLYCLWRDITERKQAESALRRSAERLQFALGAAHQGWFDAYITTGKTEVGPEYPRILGYDPAEFETSLPNWFANIHPEDLPKVQEVFQQVMLTGGPREGEYRRRTKSGAWKWMFTSGAVAERDAEGRPLRIAGIHMDIDERKRIEAELAEYRLHLEELVVQRTHQLSDANIQLSQTQFALERVGVGIAWNEIETGRIIYVNDAACEQLGYTRDEFLSLTVSDLSPDYPPEVVREIGLSILETGKPVRVETLHRCKDGRLLPFEVTAYAYHTTERDVLIAFYTDITERKRNEAALIKAKDMAEEGSRAKSTFLANMSHEIRTPLNAISGMAHLIRRSGVSTEQAARLDKLDAASEHLMHIISDILDLSKIEAGRMVLEETRLNVETVMSSVVAMVHDRAKAKGLRITTQADFIPYSVLGDPTRVQQALLNYVGNAIKFTEHGSITLRATLEQDNAKSVTIRFEVEDTGIGIPPEALDRLFTAFEQADASTTRKFGGTGLGLAINKRLVELMGGNVGVKSTPGLGSVFWLTVRLKKDDATHPHAVAGSAEDAEARLRVVHAGRRILLAEDEPVNREIAVLMLEDVGLIVDVAENGAEAVAMAQQNAYDLILMDMQMPVMDGLTATQKIRALPYGSHVPVIAITANAFAEDRAACLAAGMSDFFTKPINPAQLYITLVNWLDQPPRGR